jgi:hypothetical protein
MQAALRNGDYFFNCGGRGVKTLKVRPSTDVLLAKTVK